LPRPFLFVFCIHNVSFLARGDPLPTVSLDLVVTFPLPPPLSLFLDPLVFPILVRFPPPPLVLSFYDSWFIPKTKSFPLQSSCSIPFSLIPPGDPRTFPVPLSTGSFSLSTCLTASPDFRFVRFSNGYKFSSFRPCTMSVSLRPLSLCTAPLFPCTLNCLGCFFHPFLLFLPPTFATFRFFLGVDTWCLSTVLVPWFP